jgi:hypothetical protein
MSWRKEKKEHKWTTKAQAKRIASDHAKKSKPKHKGSKAGPIQTATSDFNKLHNGYKGVATRRVI